MIEDDFAWAPVARWWVEELSPAAAAAPYGPINLVDVEALLVRAPPVYEPGGPVCLLGPLAASSAGLLAPEAEPLLESAGYHNPAEFYEGQP